MKEALLADIGNTNTKVVFYSNGKMREIRRSSALDALGFIRGVLKKEGKEMDLIVVSNVRCKNAPIKEALAPFCKRLVVLDNKTPLPVDLKYGFDATELGADRIASALAVACLFPGKDCIKFEFGTALTVDFIDKEGRYLGGNISLGMRSRFRALKDYTGLLPYITPDPQFPPIGVTTTGAMSAGIVYGLLFEVEGYIKRYPEHQIIFSGGDAEYMAKRITQDVYVAQEMVLKGLAFIADYYIKKDEN